MSKYNETAQIGSSELLFSLGQHRFYRAFTVKGKKIYLLLNYPITFQLTGLRRHTNHVFSGYIKTDKEQQ